MSAGQLQIESGFASETGRRATNEDFAALWAGNATRPGEAIVVIADGVGGVTGRFAAESAARSFAEGYFAATPTLGVDRSAARALSAANRWLHAQRDGAKEGAAPATTLSALVLRARRAYVVHVGDSRIYRLRDGRLQRLTTDHVHPHPDLRHVLVRAVGIEPQVRADYGVHELRVHDRFLLCSDGVHGSLRDERLEGLLAVRGAPGEDARRLVTEALEAGSSDNATALVLDVLGVPPSDRIDLESAADRLPVGELPRPGEVVDGFELIEQLSDGRYARLFSARDTLESRDEVVLKFPHPRVASDAVYRAAFVRESWVAAQARSPQIAEVIELPAGRQTRLYIAMPHYHGEMLEARLRRAPAVALTEGVHVGVALARAVYALNRRRIIHRDIKPENVMLLRGGGLKLLDLGVARLPEMPECESESIPGTPSYMAPEMFDGSRGDERSEVFALGVTLYRVFSGGRYPYGEVEAFSRPRFTRYQPLARHRPDLPAWLDALLARAVAAAPADRPGDALELGLELENALARGAPAAPPPRRSLYERDPLRFWQVTAALLALGWLLTLVLR
jgi:serine/threonine protein phosphatase PrpC